MLEEGVRVKTKVTEEVIQSNYCQMLFSKISTTHFGYDDYIKLGYLYFLDNKQATSKSDTATMVSYWMVLKIGKLEKYGSPQDRNPSEVITLAAYKVTLPGHREEHRFHGDSYFLLCLEKKDHTIMFFTRTEVDQSLWFHDLQVARSPYLLHCLENSLLEKEDFGRYKEDTRQKIGDERTNQRAAESDSESRKKTLDKTLKKDHDKGNADHLSSHKRNRSLEDVTKKAPLQRTRTSSWAGKSILDNLLTMMDLHNPPIQDVSFKYNSPFQREPNKKTNKDYLDVPKQKKKRPSGGHQDSKERYKNCPTINVISPHRTVSYL